MEYKGLRKALALFSEEFWLPTEDSLGLLEDKLTNGTLNEDQLKIEYMDAMSQKNMDWIEIAKKTALVIVPEKYTNTELKDYVKLLLQDFLFPAGRMTDRQFNLLAHSVMDVLSVYTKNDGWMPIDELYSTLKSFQLFNNLELYELVNVPLRAQGMNIKEKLLEDKMVTGYMKYDKI